MLTKDLYTHWHVVKIGGSEKPLAFAKNRQDAALEVAKLERKFVNTPVDSKLKGRTYGKFSN